MDKYTITVSELEAFEAGPTHPSEVSWTSRKSQRQTHRDMQKYVIYGLLARKPMIVDRPRGCKTSIFFELTEKGHQLLAILRGDNQ